MVKWIITVGVVMISFDMVYSFSQLLNAYGYRGLFFCFYFTICSTKIKIYLSVSCKADIKYGTGIIIIFILLLYILLL